MCFLNYYIKIDLSDCLMQDSLLFKLTPSKQLVFVLTSQDTPAEAELLVKNNSAVLPLAIKVKTTNPNNFTVKPAKAII